MCRRHQIEMPRAALGAGVQTKGGVSSETPPCKSRAIRGGAGAAPDYGVTDTDVVPSVV